MKPATQQLIPTLQALYADEIAAAAQYDSHAATLTRAGLVKLAAQATEHRDDERKHAERLAARLAQWGAAPAPFGKAPPAGLGDENDFEDILAAELPLEQTAVARYEAAIAQAVESGDNFTRDLLAGNLADEIDHIDDIERAQGLKELVGRDNYAASLLG